MRAELLSPLLLIGCVGGPGLDGELDRFVAEVQPVLAERCASPSCHGRPSRPLGLFAVHQHRLDPADVHLDAPLTADELHANYDRALGFVLGASGAADAPLLRKPLAQGAGGMRHAGGIQFEDTQGFRYRSVLQWATAELEIQERTE